MEAMLIHRKVEFEHIAMIRESYAPIHPKSMLGLPETPEVILERASCYFLLSFMSCNTWDLRHLEAQPS